MQRKKERGEARENRLHSRRLQDWREDTERERERERKQKEKALKDEKQKDKGNETSTRRLEGRRGLLKSGGGEKEREGERTRE